MRKSSQMDEPFNELDKVYRSAEQKQKTRSRIFQAIESKRNKKRIFPQILTVIFAVSACFLFSYIMIFANDLMENSNSIGSVKAEKIEYIVVSSSVADSSFSAIEYSYAKGQSIIQDRTYSTLVSEMLNHSEEADDVNLSSAVLDIMIVFRENEQLRIKLWEENQHYYFKPFGSEKVYRLKSEDGKRFLDMANRMVQV